MNARNYSFCPIQIYRMLGYLHAFIPCLYVCKCCAEGLLQRYMFILPTPSQETTGKKKNMCSSYSSITINTGSVHSNTDLICTRHENTTTFFPQIRWCRQYSLCDSFMLYSGYMTAIVEQIIVNLA